MSIDRWMDKQIQDIHTINSIQYKFKTNTIKLVRT